MKKKIIIGLCVFFLVLFVIHHVLVILGLGGITYPIRSYTDLILQGPSDYIYTFTHKAPQEWVTYEDKANGFSIRLPSSINVVETTERRVSLSNQDKTQKISVSIIPHKGSRINSDKSLLWQGPSGAKFHYLNGHTFSSFFNDAPINGMSSTYYSASNVRLQLTYIFSFSDILDEKLIISTFKPL